MEKNWIEQVGVEYWKPEEKGEELQGEIIRIDVSENFGQSYAVKTDEGNVSVTPSHAVLQSRMRGAKIGDWVKITFEGEQKAKTKGHNPMKLYKVFLAK